MTQIVTTKTSANILGLSDWLKGFLVAIISSVLTVIYTSFSAGSLTFEYKSIALVAGTSGIGYLLKNGFSPAVTTITPPPGTVAGETVTVQIPAPGKTITETITKP